MKVRIKIRPSGLINGAEWPAVGELVDLPDLVATSMLGDGLVEVAPLEEVEPVPTPDPTPTPPTGTEETATPPTGDVETATPPAGDTEASTPPTGDVETATPTRSRGRRG